MGLARVKEAYDKVASEDVVERHRKSRFGECTGFSNGKGKDFNPNKETFTTSLKRKLIMLFKEIEAPSELDRREWRKADIALYDTVMQLHPRGWNFTRQNN